ncbi:MAG: discoidin domain-containing protein, partial [Thermoguttaceae bacterium]|nr:discoidin domain-containing protein [Thermoguttaceae bacterium]
MRAQNLAAGAKYTLWPQPNYEHCTDPGDTTQLTDGKTSQAYFWTQRGTVGWSGAPYATVTVDLGRVEPISGVSLNTAAGVAGVVWPAAIHILVSDDGKQFRDVADLVLLDRKAHGPFPQGYAIRRLATDELQTKGRYVCFMMVPLAGCPFLFVDEVEVFRGPQGLLEREPGGKPVASVASLFQEVRARRGVEHRFRSDIERLEAAIRSATLRGGEEARRRLLGQLDALRKELDASKIAVTEASFQAVLPLSEGHARLFALEAELWRDAGAQDLAVAKANPWDPLDPFAAPRSSGEPIEVHAMRGEHRAAAIDLFNSTPQALEVTVRFEGLPGSPTPAYVAAHAVRWTDTSQGVPVASALPEATRLADGWRVTVFPGLVQQVWLSLHPVDLPPGEHRGHVVLRAGSIERRVPIGLRVWPFDFPRRTTLLVGGWSYTDGDTYGVTAANREAFLKHLHERFVNTPWATAAVLMSFQSTGADGEKIELDTRRFDAWVAQWPDAARYMVFASVGPTFAGKRHGTPEFDRLVGAWITAWVRHLKSKGIGPDRLGLLLHDEPHEGTDVGPIVSWAKAIRSAAPGVLIWEDPTYRDPGKAPAELFEVCHILCPNRPMWLEGGKPFEAFYLDQKRRGRTLQFYSCSGPAKLLDPYTYYRLQAWHGWQIGATGSFFWAFGDNGGASSWNEYLAKAGPFTPLFLDEKTVTPGKQMEAVRESVEDFETLAMLRRAVERAKAAGRADAAVASAETLLKHAADEVLAAPGAGEIHWHKPKDRVGSTAVLGLVPV